MGGDEYKRSEHHILGGPSESRWHPSHQAVGFNFECYSALARLYVPTRYSAGTNPVPVMHNYPSNNRRERNPKYFLHQSRGEGVYASRIKVCCG